MAGIKPVIRESREASLKGMAHSRDKLHQLADNISDHLRDISGRVKGNDHFDGSGGSGSGTSPGGSSDLVPRPETLGPDGRIDWGQAPHDGFVSPAGEDGPFSYDSRSMPYTENPNAYHAYEWTGELGDAGSRYDQLSAADRDIVDSGLSYFGQDVNHLSPVARGEAAAIPAWNLPGGATQDKLPVSVEMLQVLGLVREV